MMSGAPWPGPLSGIPGLSAWFDITQGLYQDSALTVPVTADGDMVGGWVDRQNSHPATQGTTASKPLYKTGIQNGRAMLLFDGSNDGLIMATVGALLSGTDVPHTRAVVFKFVGTTGTTCLLGAGNAGSVTPFDALQKSSNGFAHNRRDDANVNLTNARLATLDTAAHVLISVFDGATDTLYLDGVNLGSGSIDVGALTLTTGSIGCLNRTSISQTISGYIGEALQFGAALPPGNVERLHAGLKNKWGTP